MKTIERAHLPKQLWEKIKLPKNYNEALKVIDEHLEFWAKFQRHKCKQRLTKLHQMIIRQRKLKVSAMHTQEEIVSINKRYEKRETKREAKALIAAKLETAIEKELLNRLQKGTYKDIYNLEQTEFEKALDEEELVEEKFEAEPLSGEDDYDSEDLSDLEEGEDELEEERLSESELDALEAQENKDRDIEEAYKSTKDSPKKSNQSKLGKRPRQGVELSYEYEHEREDVKSKSMDKVKKRPKNTVDF